MFLIRGCCDLAVLQCFVENGSTLFYLVSYPRHGYRLTLECFAFCKSILLWNLGSQWCEGEC